MLGGTPRLGILATLNLSQISEFALVICSLGMNYGHIDASTLEIIIWVFMILPLGPHETRENMRSVGGRSSHRTS